MKRKTIGFLLFGFLFSIWGATAQTSIIKGTVVDPEGTPLPGVTVQVKGKTNGTATTLDGKYALANVSPNDELEFLYIGFEKQTIKVGNQQEINVVMKEDATELEELTVVAFQKQKKESVISSITTVSPKELKVPSSNLTTAFAGKLAGLIAYQRSGEPGMDNADFFIRGVTTFGYSTQPLILIDGLESTKEDLARVDPDNVETFSIMKDATAAALYGSRGGNGVILITTKTGKKGKISISARLESQVSTPTKLNTFLDGVTYMEMYNEALRMRNPHAPLTYSKEKIEGTRRNLDPEAYPNVDWYNTLFNDAVVNYKANLSATGGGEVAQYYLSVAYTNEKGLLKVDPLNNFNNNINIDRFNVRANVNFNLTKTTKAALKMYQLYDIYNGPMTSASDLFTMVMQTNPVTFPPTYTKPDDMKFIKHTMFGTASSTSNIPNPYAQMVRGYKDQVSSTNQAQFSIEQNLDMLTKGLMIRALAATNIYSRTATYRYFYPFYYTMVPEVSELGVSHKLSIANEGYETLTASIDPPIDYSSMYFEGAMQYDRVFKKHSVGGLLVATSYNGINEYLKEYLKDPGKNTLLNDVLRTLPSRNIGLAGRATYNFDSRYYLEANFGYNGSEKFSKKYRWGFFPSMGLAWNLTNEPFYSDIWKKYVNLLKLKFTYGYVGTDALGHANDRFYYFSLVEGNDGNYGYTWGEDFTRGYSGYSISRYANNNISWEISEKTNYGIELGLFDKMTLQVDYFTEFRDRIYMNLDFLPETMGLTAPSMGNIGQVDSWGIDGSLDMNWAVNKSFWITSRLNYTFARNILKQNGEPDYYYKYRSSIGLPHTQCWGFVAERLFTDYEDIRNSPPQFVAKETLQYNEQDAYAPGDIKYVDINKDGKIDDNDRVPIGYPDSPEIIYGFGVSMGYKHFDLSLFFQGSARSSFFIQPATIAPFVGQRNALQIIADDHWSYDNPDPHAFWPRMSVTHVENNVYNSTWWLRDGAFLRLKTLETGYTIPNSIISKYGIRDIRFYFSGSNLFCFSKFKMWDPEMGGNGLKYPTQRVFNLGLQFTF